MDSSRVRHESLQRLSISAASRTYWLETLEKVDIISSHEIIEKVSGK